jgi:hypothetical protein
MLFSARLRGLKGDSTVLNLLIRQITPACVFILLIIAVLSAPSGFCETTRTDPPNEAQATTTEQEEKGGLPHPLQTCLDKENSQWREPEHWAWSRICARLPIDFDTRYGTPRNQQALDSFANDPKRYLSREFFSQILRDDLYASEILHSGLDITGMYSKDVDIIIPQIPTIRITHSLINGTLSVRDTKVDYRITLINSAFDYVSVSSVSAHHITIEDTKISRLRIGDLRSDYFAISKSHIDSMNIGITDLNQKLYFKDCHFENIGILASKFGNLSLLDDEINNLSVANTTIIDNFLLQNVTWVKNSNQQDSGLVLSSVRTFRFDIIPREVRLPANLPDRASIFEFDFVTGDWGLNPIPVLERLAAITDLYIPKIYTSLAKAYNENSQPETARAILIVGQETALHYSQSWFQILWLLAMRSLVMFGYLPELGFMWILTIVVMASIIFVCESKDVTSEYRPGNWWMWLMFSLDAVLPGITLDKKFEEVRFKSWQQYVIYFLRFLGVVVVLLVVFFIRRAFLPAD